MHLKLAILFLLSSTLPSSLGILRPKFEASQSVESDISRQGVPRPIAPQPVPPRNQQTQQPSPSRELLPPLVSPQGPVVQSNALPSQPQPNNAAQPQSQGSSEKFELLPPVEIPPAFPIDGNNRNDQQENSINTDSGRVIFQASDDAFTLPDALPGRQQSSLVPTTGLGSSGGTISNQIPIPEFRSPQPQRRPLLISPTTASPTQTTRDSGVDCLGTCDCPADFTFVCGSNRFLYQNECALECDKKCHPDLLKVSMAQCS